MADGIVGTAMDMIIPNLQTVYIQSKIEITIGSPGLLALLLSLPSYTTLGVH